MRKERKTKGLALYTKNLPKLHFMKKSLKCLPVNGHLPSKHAHTSELTRKPVPLTFTIPTALLARRGQDYNS